MNTSSSFQSLPPFPLLALLLCGFLSFSHFIVSHFLNHFSFFLFLLAFHMCLKGTPLCRVCFFFATILMLVLKFLFLIKTFEQTVNHFKRVQHVYSVLDARKCWMKNFLWNKFHPTPSNMIFFFFYEMLDEIGTFKKIQLFVQRASQILHVE